MKIYVAGPMTGHKDLNFPLFHQVAEALRELGHIVLNPAEICPDPGAKWSDCMKADIKALVDCHAVALLPGWTTSKGARLEVSIATSLKMIVQPWQSSIFKVQQSACTHDCLQGRRCTCKPKQMAE